jgi:V/A-type H+/Na+-transporting ATPase subunit A
MAVENMVKGTVISVNGPIIKATGMDDAGMLDLVYVGKNELVGEIIRLNEGIATIQVYEDNSMMQIGETVLSYNRPLSVLLGPGLLEGI